MPETSTLMTAASDAATAHLYAQIVAGLTGGVISVDEEGVIAVVNPAAARHLNVAPESLQPGTRLGAVQGAAELAELFAQLRRTGQPVSRREVRLDTQDGRRIIGVTASLISGPKRFNGVTFLFADLTEVRELERAAQLNQQLAQIGELTAGVVHEVRNPLSVISGMAELLMRKLGREHPFHDQAALIYQEAGQLEKLVNQFLGFAKPFQVEKRRCAPETVVDRAVRLCARLAQEKGVAVQVTTAENIPYIEADEAKLSQALANVVQNAVEIVGVEGKVSVQALLRDNTMVFRVEDDGPGIQLSDGENLLSPFFSKKQAGTGLGLSIVHRIITAHGGAVKYGNRDEGGAWFELRLPLEDGTV